MSATARLVLLSLTVALMVASCGQKGPLRMPEKNTAVSAARVHAPASPSD